MKNKVSALAVCVALGLVGAAALARPPSAHRVRTGTYVSDDRRVEIRRDPRPGVIYQFLVARVGAAAGVFYFNAADGTLSLEAGFARPLEVTGLRVDGATTTFEFESGGVLSSEYVRVSLTFAHGTGALRDLMFDHRRERGRLRRLGTFKQSLHRLRCQNLLSEDTRP